MLTSLNPLVGGYVSWKCAVARPAKARWDNAHWHNCKHWPKNVTSELIRAKIMMLEEWVEREKRKSDWEGE
jgi:hypothetical protein